MHRTINTKIGLLIISGLSLLLVYYCYLSILESRRDIPQSVVKRESPQDRETDKSLDIPTKEEKPVPSDKKATRKEIDCSQDREDVRICKDGKTVKRFDEKCMKNYCLGSDATGNRVFYYSPYIKDQEGIFWERGFDRTLSKVEGADIKTFNYIGGCASMEMSGAVYARDKNYIYINEKQVKDIDAGSFHYYGSFLTGGCGMPSTRSIARDRKHIYHSCGEIAGGFDEDTFKEIGGGYFKDKNNIYYITTALNEVDRKSFQLISNDLGNFDGSFALDQNRLYLGDEIIEGINPQICMSKGLKACLPEHWCETLNKQ